jgi:PAS domain S-box-containing protein
LFLAAQLPGATPRVNLTPGENYSISIYNVYAGLPNNSAPFVHQTPDGYMWIGTEFGLARFDGVRFTNYRIANTPELPSNLIRYLHSDSSGSLWIATQRGLCRYRAGKFERVGFEGSAVTMITEDAAHHLWFGTGDKGLWELRDERLVHHDEPGLPADNNVNVLFCDSRDRLWVGNTTDIACFDRASMRRIDLGTLPFGSVGHMTEGANGTLWFETPNGLYRMRGTDIRHYGPEEGLGADPVRNLFVDRQNRVWVSMVRLYSLDAQENRFRSVELAGVENPRFMVQDLEGSYWVGTAGDGIVRLRRSGFRMLTPEDGLLGGNTRTVATEPDGTAWVGLSVAGLARIAPDGTTSVLDTGVGFAGEVWSITPARDGTLWIGTRSSLRAWKDGRMQEFPEYQRVRATYEDRSGTIWISSETAGLVRYRDGKFTPLAETVRALQPTSARTIAQQAMVFAEDDAGTLYIGFRDIGGLATVRDDKFTIQTPSESFPGADIRAIYPDHDGNLWLGTRGHGLIVFTGGQWRSPDSLSVTLNDQVATILEDAQHRLWLGTPRGIVWAPKADLLAIARGERRTTAFRLAETNDGVRPGVVGAGNFPTAVRAADGRLWITSRHGLVLVDPPQIAINTQPPPVQVENVAVDEHPLAFADRFLLSPGARTLAIDYTALTYTGPTQVQFRYRLEGHDLNWTDAGSRRTAFYTNLAPGTYRFHVIASNDDGVWNETGASVALVQLPFFYQTGWFYGLVGLGLVGAGFGVFRWRTAALQRRNLVLQRGIAERTAELAKSYEAIRASEYFYHSLVESLPQIILRKDAEGRITYANSAFAELIGRPLDEVIGKTEFDLYPAAQAEKNHASDRLAMERRETIEFETIAETRQGRRFLHVKKVPLYDQEGRALGVQMLFWDMTTFREMEDKLKHAQHKLVETSRLAGIAEMATGILHNLGNALNSVNTASNTVTERIRESKIASVAKTAQLLAENADRLPEFFAQDPRARQLPPYLKMLGDHLAAERAEVMRELETLQKNVDHIKELVATQQSHARVGGVKECLPASELVELALRINESSLARHEIAVVREFSPGPMVNVERQKALQVINNLITNARDAIDGNPGREKQITLGVGLSPQGRVQISVTDTGVGIAPENLTRIFAFGFTTKQDGHGFGLHSSALAAKEMGGALHAFSKGIGLGATFVFELPAA